MIKMEEKGNKVYIYVKDEDNEYETAEWTTIVDRAEFEWCVKQKEKLGFHDPEGSAMMDYGFFDHCFVPKPVSVKEKARRLFDMVMEQLQFEKDKDQILEALKDMIDDYIYMYRNAGGEEE